MASLKDQLDQAGYDTSTLDEGAVLKQLSDAGYDVSSYSTPSTLGVMDQIKLATKMLPTALAAPMDVSKKLGTMVEAGGAGIGDIDAYAIPTVANTLVGTNFQHPSFSEAVNQGGNDVNAVMAGLTPQTAAGQAGKFLGSFVTPNQIALQATGAEAAGPVIEGLSNIAKPVVKGVVNAFPRISNLLGAAPEAVSALAENPEAVSTAQSLPKTAETVVNSIGALGNEGMAAAQAGKAALSDTTPVVGLKDKLMQYAGNLGTGPGADDADKAAADYVLKYAKSLDLNPSERDVAALIDDLDSKINTKFAQANPSVLTEAKKAIRLTLSQALKGQNSQYADLMAQAENTFAPQEALTKAFGIKEGLPSDATIAALRNKANPEALATQRVLAGSFPGLSETISNAAAKDALQQSLLGKAALWGIPKLRNLIQSGVQAIPAAGNAVYQGLTQ